MKLRVAALAALVPVLIPTPAMAAEPRGGCRRSELYQEARTERGVVARDLDGDGLPDGLKVTDESSGSGSSGFDVELRLSTLSKSIAISREQTFYSFLGFVAVPPELLGLRMTMARDAVESVLFDVVCDQPDPSLRWLLESSRVLRWQPERPSLPETYGMYSTAPEIRARAIGWLSAGSRDPAPTPTAVWIWYGGWNHRRDEWGGELKEFRTIAKRSGLELLATAHGVVLFDAKKSRHAWIYVQPGGQKLRLPTIFGARFDGSYAVIDVRLGQIERRGVVRVDLETGKVTERFCQHDEWNEMEQACSKGPGDQPAYPGTWPAP